MKILKTLNLGALLIFSTASIFADDNSMMTSSVASATVASVTVSGSTLLDNTGINSTVNGSTLEKPMLPNLNVTDSVKNPDTGISGSVMNPQNN